MIIKGYTLVNAEKLDRALNGAQQADSSRIGGVGNGAYYEKGWKKEGVKLEAKEVDVLETALLAEYDKLGGLIYKDSDKVKMGSFYDFKAKKPFVKPVVKLVFMINGKEVEIVEDAPVPAIVQAARTLQNPPQEVEDDIDEEEESGVDKKGKPGPKPKVK